MLMTTLNIGFGLVTVASLIYAIYANRKTARIIDYNREQAWEIYRQSTKVLGHYQDLEKSNLKEPSQVEHVAKGEMAAQEVLLSAVRMIKRFEKKFTKETISKWLQEGKLPNESHAHSFNNYADE